MKTNIKRIIVLSVTTVTVTLGVFAIDYLRIERPTPPTQLEETVARLPLGITAEAVDERLGSAPDRVATTEGVLMSANTMLSPENELAKEYGSPQTYSLRQWQRDGVWATVVLNTDGVVAAKWAGRLASNDR